jgi:hypothetical protein
MHPSLLMPCIYAGDLQQTACAQSFLSTYANELYARRQKQELNGTLNPLMKRKLRHIVEIVL